MLATQWVLWMFTFSISTQVKMTSLQTIAALLLLLTAFTIAQESTEESKSSTNSKHPEPKVRQRRCLSWYCGPTPKRRLSRGADLSPLRDLLDPLKEFYGIVTAKLSNRNYVEEGANRPNYKPGEFVITVELLSLQEKEKGQNWTKSKNRNLSITLPFPVCLGIR